MLNWLVVIEIDLDQDHVEMEIDPIGKVLKEIEVPHQDEVVAAADANVHIVLNGPFG